MTPAKEGGMYGEAYIGAGDAAVRICMRRNSFVNVHDEWVVLQRGEVLTPSNLISRPSMWRNSSCPRWTRPTRCTVATSTSSTTSRSSRSSSRLWACRCRRSRSRPRPWSRWTSSPPVSCTSTRRASASTSTPVPSFFINVCALKTCVCTSSSPCPTLCRSPPRATSGS